MSICSLTFEGGHLFMTRSLFGLYLDFYLDYIWIIYV